MTNPSPSQPSNRAIVRPCKYDFEEVRQKLYRGPRMTSLMEHFERIAAGLAQRPNGPVLADKSFLGDSRELNDYHDTLQKSFGTFLKHGCASIPFLLEEIIRVGLAVNRCAHLIANESSIFHYYESSSADGTAARTLAEYSKGKIKTLTDSPNEANQLEFRRLNRSLNAHFHLGCFADVTPEFLATTLPQFKGGFDFVWENTTFQMYGNHRHEQIAYMKRILKDSGVILFLEKLKHPDDVEYRKREQIKDEVFKSRYFCRGAIAEKQALILQTMEAGQCDVDEFISVAESCFKNVALIWNSSNFYHIAASDDLGSFTKFIDSLEPAFVPAEFTHEAPRIIKTAAGRVNSLRLGQNDWLALRLPKVQNVRTPQTETLFEIVSDTTRTVPELQDLFAQGYSVLRSSHIGNLSAANLLIANSGIPILLHELLPLNARPYIPAFKLINNKEIPLTPREDAIALYTALNPSPEKDGARTPIHYHFNELTRKWPNAKALHDFISTIGDELVSELLERFFRIDGEVANMFVDRNGLVRPITIRERADRSDCIMTLLRRHCSNIQRAILNNTVPQETVIPDTAAMIVLVTIADLLDPHRVYLREKMNVANVYHLAGEQMFNYLVNNRRLANKYTSRICKLYDEARLVIPALPAKLVFHLVPTQYIGNLVTCGGPELLQEAFILIREIEAIRGEIRTIRGELLKPYQVCLNSLSDWEQVRDYMATHVPSSIIRCENPAKLSQEQYERDPSRFKARLLGKLARVVGNTDMATLESGLKAIKSRLRTVVNESALIAKPISQYDLPSDDNDFLDAFEPLLRYNMMELKNLLTAIKNASK